MKQIKYNIKLFFCTSLLLCVVGFIGAQQDDTVQNMYCVSVKQTFSSWGGCSSDPDYGYAEFKLYEDEPNELIEVIHSDRLNQIVNLDRNFYIHSFDKNLSNLVDNNDDTLSEIKVHTYAGDIINDNDLYYAFDISALFFGKNEEPHEASDPCHNLISSNREGYTMTTTIYIDDPVNLSYTGEHALALESQVLRLEVSDFYRYNYSNSTVLQVSPDNVDNWENIQGVSISPSSTLNLSYVKIAGSKLDTNSHYFEWMGKNLKFRIVKTLMNGKKTFGQIVSGVTFYPQGLQYSILQTNRSTCNDTVIIYVKLEDGADEGYFNLDPEYFSWQLTDDFNTFFHCEMQETSEPLTYRLLTDLDSIPVDPFSDENLDPIEWTLQLLDKNNLGSFACQRTFTIPPKPDSISISQIDSLYFINGNYYDVPDMNNLFALLSINDPWDFAYLRQPYTIKEGSSVLQVIDDLPDIYNNMTQQQKDSMDAIFEAEFTDMIEKPNNPYMSYFNMRLDNWLEDHQYGFPITNNGAMWIKFAENGNFFLYVTNTSSSFYGYIYKVPINGNAINDGVQKTTNSTEKAPIITPDGSTCIYVKDYTYSDHTIWKAPLAGDEINNGIQISTSRFSDEEIMAPDASYIIVMDPENPGFVRINLSTNVSTNVYSEYASQAFVSPNGSSILFTDNYGDLQKAPLYNGVIGTPTEISTNDYYLTRYTPNGEYMLATRSSGSDFWSLHKISLTGSDIGQAEQINSQFYSFLEGFDISPDGTYYLYTYHTNDPTTDGIYQAPLTGSGINNGIRINPAYVHGSVSISPDGSYFLFVNGDDNYRIYKQYLNTASAFDDFYPNIGDADAWYNTYKESYKQKWLAKRLGVKVTNGIKVNQYQHLTLTDSANCSYPFDIYVHAPSQAYFTTTLVSNPSDACANNGSVRVTYNGGGVPPYVHPDGTLTTSGNSIIVSGMSYGENLIYFTDANGNESQSLPFTIGSATIGITSTSSTPHTCASANGSITINVGNVTGTKIYTVTCDYPVKKYTLSTTSNSCTFSNLPAGTYFAEVETSTCYFTEADITVGKQVFSIDITNTTDAATINGTGSVSMSFTNRVNNVYWISGVPSVFNVSENANSVSYLDVEPQTYNFTAQHTDTYSKTCLVSGNFTINHPQFAASVNLIENSDSCIATVSLTSGNSLITPYNFRLLNYSGEIISQGGNGNNLSAIIKEAGDYTINMQYGINNVDIYSFSYPASPIGSTYSLYPPACPGGDGSINISPSGGIDGANFLMSTDGLTFFNTTTFPVQGGVFTYFIKDENITNQDVYGSTISVNRSKTERFEVPVPEPDPVSATIIIPIDITCAGYNNGSVSIGQVSGGSGYYQYRVDDGAWFDTLSTITGISTGNHSVYLRDSYNNCSMIKIGNIALSEPDSLKFSEIEVLQSTCNTNNAFIRVVMTGGTMPYSYLWNDFFGNLVGTDSLIANLEQSGYYYLEVSDAKNCPQHFEQAINPSNGPSIGEVEIDHLECFGDSAGSAKILEVFPATPFAPWWLNWSDGSTSDSASGFPAGLHFVSVTDTNNCVFTRYFTVTGPDRLGAEITNERYACFGKNDGFIQVEGQGGVGGYSFAWSNGDVTNRADSLYSGNYSLLITDLNDCQSLQTFVVSQPDEAVVDLGDDLTVCPGNTITLDGQDFTTHNWSTPSGFFSDERFVDINSENEYYLEVTDNMGCNARDTLVLRIGNNALDADFLMTSEAFLGDTLTIFELSNLELDSMQWEYNTSVFSDITNSLAADYVLELENSDTGIYNVTLRAYSGGCISQVVKQVEIIYDTDTTDDDYGLGFRESLITSFIVSPNPNEGTFNVKISLREVSDIQLVIFSVSYGAKVNERFEYGLKDYEFSYTLNGLEAGTYIIMLNAGDERKQVKMIIL